MGKVVVYSLLATAFILFLLLSPPPNQPHHQPRSLSRRLGSGKFPTFDPLVTKMERLAEENGSGSSNPQNYAFGGELEEEYGSFDNEGRLNISLRLIVLFPFLDKEPKDGLVSFKELEDWNIQQAMNRLSYLTDKELTSRDQDGDGAISFREYLPHFSNEDLEKNGMAHGEAGWYKEQFINADADQNGTLNFPELNDFLHPEDSDKEAIQKWLLREKIKRMDYDNDGKLNFGEFLNHAYDIFKNYFEFETAGTDVPEPEEKFAELDENKDKFLEVDELKPILRYLYPGEMSYAKYYTSYLFHETDDNRDGKLSLDEMLNHEYIFYNTVYDDEEEDDYFHDEL